MDIFGETLDTVKTNFVIQEEDEEISNSNELKDLSFKQQTEIQTQFNTDTINYLTESIRLLREGKKFEEASKLVAKAYRRCPSITTKQKIALANKSIKAAIKAERWSKIKRRKHYVDDSTIRRNLDTFYEKVSEIISIIKRELDKNNLTLFSKIKKEYESDLPVVLPPGTYFTVKRAHIVAMCESVPNKKYKFTCLESTLYLIEDVKIIGINRNAYKNTLEQAKLLVGKKGKTVYDKPISRTSNNIDWYIVLDFGCNIRFASFADKLELTENDGDTSFEGYVKQQAAEQKTMMLVKSASLARIRADFIENNKSYYDDIKVLTNQLENIIDRRKILRQEYKDITNISSEEEGLDLSQNKRLYTRSIAYRNQLMQEGKSFKNANFAAIMLRIEARTTQLDFIELSLEAKELKNRIEFLTTTLTTKRIMYAKQMGMKINDDLD